MRCPRLHLLAALLEESCRERLKKLSPRTCDVKDVVRATAVRFYERVCDAEAEAGQRPGQCADEPRKVVGLD